ncbi:MAG: TetR/AcrR family transcriptional regulator [Rhodoglobus sp.]
MPRAITTRSDVIGLLAETFRTYGFNGASIAVISARTQMGKGSLYNYFPGGKEEMAAAVLDSVQEWFEEQVNVPLRAPGDSAVRIDAMFDACHEYFNSRQLVCLFGLFALGHEREQFGSRITAFFDRWIDALAPALRDGGMSQRQANVAAANLVVGIQGALVVSRASADATKLGALLETLRATVGIARY